MVADGTAVLVGMRWSALAATARFHSGRFADSSCAGGHATGQDLHQSVSPRARPPRTGPVLRRRSRCHAATFSAQSQAGCGVEHRARTVVRDHSCVTKCGRTGKDACSALSVGTAHHERGDSMHATPVSGQSGRCGTRVPRSPRWDLGGTRESAACDAAITAHIVGRPTLCDRTRGK